MASEGNGTSGTATVYFANNYPMALVRDLWSSGQYPAHHLWGGLHLEQAGFQVRYSNFGQGGLLDSLSKALRGRAGDLALTAGAVRCRPRPGAIFAGDPTSLQLLAFGGGVPVVSVVHPSPPREGHYITAKAVSRYTEVICLSRVVYDRLLELPGRSEDNTTLLPWGPDLAFAGYANPSDGGYVMAAGKTGRDHALLAEAARKAGVPVRIPEPGNIPLYEFLPKVRAASVIAIPLLDAGTFFGLTELDDALAMGKPVVMTRSPYAADLDIEAIGCGRWVEPGDLEGWRRVLTELMSDPELRAQMGAAGRRYAEEVWNADRFGEGVVRVLRRAMVSG